MRVWVLRLMRPKGENRLCHSLTKTLNDAHNCSEPLPCLERRENNTDFIRTLKRSKAMKDRTWVKATNNLARNSGPSL